MRKKQSVAHLPFYENQEIYPFTYKQKLKTIKLPPSPQQSPQQLRFQMTKETKKPPTI